MRLNMGDSLVMEKLRALNICPTLALSRVGISPAALFVRKMGCRPRQRIDLDQCGMSQRGGA
jgi:hypothetical protein